MIDPRHFRLHVVRPALAHMRLWSMAAENLMVGTAVQESGLKYLKQLSGPALGVYQIEPATHNDLWANYLALDRRALQDRVLALLAPSPSRRSQLVTNLAYATAMARLVYWRRPEPLPGPDDIEGLGGYWKSHYNTPAGAGTAPQFVLNYRENVK